LLGAQAQQQAAGGPPPAGIQAELERAQRRLQLFSVSAVELIALSTVCMALGRYV